RARSGGPITMAETISLVDTAVRRQAELEQAAALAVTTALARAADVSEAAEAVNDALRRSTRLERTAVLLYGADRLRAFVAWRGPGGDARRELEQHCPWPQDALDVEPMLVEDVASDPALAHHHETFRREGIAALAFVPVTAKSGVVGRLTLFASSPSSI